MIHGPRRYDLRSEEEVICRPKNVRCAVQRRYDMRADEDMICGPKKI